jgi:hypothetical protein
VEGNEFLESQSSALKENELDSYTQQRIWLFLCMRGQEDKAAGSG